jgi:hypothetical protein
MKSKDARTRGLAATRIRAGRATHNNCALPSVVSR